MSILTRKLSRGNAGEIEIDGKKLRVLDYRKDVSVHDADKLYMTVTGNDLPFGNVPHSFMWAGDEWWVQSMSINASSDRRAIEMQLEATNKKFSGRETTPGPWSRQPSVPKAAPVDVHEQCVPKEHYQDLKGLAVQLLNMHHNGSIELNTVDLDYLEDWQILHTKTDADTTGFLAIPPEVHVET